MDPAARRRAARRKTICFVLLAAAAVGCGPRADDVPGVDARAPRLVLLFAPCSVSRLYLGPYNPDVAYTPALSAFAREGTVFLRHETESGQSGVAYASILSGTQADRHGVYRHPARLADEAHLLAEAFAERGYETHFWSGQPMASADLNYDQGVPARNVHVRPWGESDPESLAANDADFAAILERLRRDPSSRAFVQVIFTVTHSPYTSVDPRALADFRREFPGEWSDLTDAQIARDRRRYRRHRRRLQWDFPSLVRERRWGPDDVRSLASTLEVHYAASIRLLDRLFGRLLESIREAGLLDQSLVAFTADHGETLYREDALFHWTHGLQLSPDAIQVPLIIRLPGRRGVPQLSGVTRSIDVHPTLLGLAGLSDGRDDRVDGADLSRAVLGSEPPPALRSFSHTMPLTPELVNEFDGWLVSTFFPTTDVSLVWTAVRDADTCVRRRRDQRGRWIDEAFDLRADPGASRDIFDPGVPLHRELAREAEAYQRRLVAAAAGSAAGGDDGDAARQRLRALGYIE